MKNFTFFFTTLFCLFAFHLKAQTLTVFPGPTVSVQCNGGSDGMVQIMVTGGSGTYQFSTFNMTTSMPGPAAFGPSPQNIFGLTAGNYSVMVSDAITPSN